MKRTTRVVLAIALALLTTGPVYAQKGRSSSSPQVQTFQEVERGFWLRSAFGVSVTLTDVFKENTKKGDVPRESSIWPPGFLIGLEMGYDLGQVAAIHLGMYGRQISGTQKSGDDTISTDADVLLLLLGGRFNLATTKRVGFFVKANVGYMLASPDLAKVGDGVEIQAGGGVEYATQLRHFFVGLEALASYLPNIGGFSAIVTPTLKYTF
jgi:hypothetical protein